MKRATKKMAGLAAALLLAALLTANAAALAGVDQTTVYICGNKLSAAHLLEGVTYVPLRAFAAALSPNAQFQWDGERDTATIVAKDLTLTVTAGDHYLTANGRCLYLGGESYVEDGCTLVPVRPLAKAFGVQVRWDEVRKEVLVEGEPAPIQSGDDFYDADSLYWLSHIISAEARGESLEGQIAVGNVVLNRMANDYWPDSVYDVIFDDRCGVQFSPTANGTVYNEPAESAVVAAKLALEGANVAGDSLFFLNEAVATSKWIVENCEFVKTIGNHSFYTKDV